MGYKLSYIQKIQHCWNDTAILIIIITAKIV